MSRPSYRAAWTLIDKVLNKALDFDVRISHPGSFSTCAAYLDEVVRKTLIKIAAVTDLSLNEERSLRLKIDKGGCGIISASNKMHFVHLASACQVLPAVGKHLREMGWRENSIEGVVNFVGVEQCLQMLGRKGILISTTGCIHVSPPTYPINGKSILWGQARKLIGVLSDKL